MEAEMGGVGRGKGMEDTGGDGVGIEMGVRL